MAWRSRRQYALTCLVILLLNTLLYIVGLSLYHWYYLDDGSKGGLWQRCGSGETGDENCYYLNKRFYIPDVENTKLPDSWLATEILLVIALVCVLVSAIANIIWVLSRRPRLAALVSAGFHLMAGIFSVSGVIVYGVYWEYLTNGFAFWLVVVAAGLFLLVGLVATLLLVCMPHTCGLCSCHARHARRYVTRARPKSCSCHQHQCSCSQAQPTPPAPCNCSNTTVVRPQILSLPAPEPKPEPPKAIIIRAPTAVPRATEPDDIHVNCTYNGGMADAYGGYSLYNNNNYGYASSNHSAQIYVTDASGGCTCGR